MWIRFTMLDQYLGLELSDPISSTMVKNVEVAIGRSVLEDIGNESEATLPLQEPRQPLDRSQAQLEDKNTLSHCLQFIVMSTTMR
jgi:hypothetical protein